MNKKQSGVDNPNLFITVLIFLAISVGVIIFGIFRGVIGSEDESADDSEVAEIIVTEEEESLLEYFENVNLSSGSGEGDEYYLETDPFKDTCADTSGDGTPVISFGTVCYR